MKRFLITIMLIMLLATNVSASEITAPAAPESVQKYMPSQSHTFGEDLWYIVKNAIGDIFPSFKSAVGICLSVIAVTLIVSILKDLSSLSGRTVELVGAVSVGVLLLSSSNALVHLARETVVAISQYGKLLLPVLTAALAAEGGTVTSAALYTGTVVFDTILTTVISHLIIPILYAYIAVCIAAPAVSSSLLKNFKDFFKWLMTWTLKLGIYIFTGYLGITKVISGTTDAAALKAAKLAISGTVPVVGGIISDASEAILVSTGIMKNAAGVYGILAIIAICLVPFLTIGVQYILLKLTAGICSLFGSSKIVGIIRDISFSMGILLATTGTMCIMLLISTVCFLKGVT